VPVLIVCNFLPVRQLWAQQVTGIVTDETNQPIPGANVIVKGTTNGVITNADGSYAITPADAQKDVLHISFIGLDPQDISINGQRVINVQLKSGTLQIEEVVAVGYGVVKKKDLTGSVASVKADDIARTTSSNAMQAMQAQVPRFGYSAEQWPGWCRIKYQFAW
jgi:hypothetical protein